MSKPVFAYRVLKVAEQGVLDLDAPLTRYTQHRFVDSDPRLELITARRVLACSTRDRNTHSQIVVELFQAGSAGVFSGSFKPLPGFRLADCS